MAYKHFSGRTLARSQAMQLLFQAEVTGRLVSEVLEGGFALDERLANGYRKELEARKLTPDDFDAHLADLDSYTRRLALGVDSMLHELDAVIAQTSSNWSVSRMPAVDRNLVRIALYEMFYVDEVDTAVAIDECVELAKAYGTDESSRFVNGLLGKVARRVDAGHDVLAEALEAARVAAEAAREAEEAAASEAAADEDEAVADEASVLSDEAAQDLPDWAQE